jgi:uncharacterized protein with HEPN domain
VWLYALAIVGEALNKVSAEIKRAAPDLPWKTVVDLRNIIVHGYWQIDWRSSRTSLKTDSSR